MRTVRGRREWWALAMLAALLPALLAPDHWRPTRHGGEEHGTGHARHCHGTATCSETPPIATSGLALLAAAIGPGATLFVASPALAGPTPLRGRFTAVPTPPPRLAAIS